MFNLLAAALIAAFSSSVFAQPATPAQPASPEAAVAAQPATPPAVEAAVAAQPANPPAVEAAIPAEPAKKGIKITKITGTVNIMKDGVVVMTLKPGDAIPEITDNSVSFAVVDGTIEVEAGGKTISAATGSSFSVSSTNGQTNVALGAGTPVAVKTESGNNLVLTANSEVKMVNTNGTVQIAMEKGNAVMTDATGGQTQTVTAGQAVVIPSVPAAAPAPAPAPAPVAEEPVAAPVADEPAAVEETPVFIPEVVAPVEPTVIPTEVVQEATELSPSNP